MTRTRSPRIEAERLDAAMLAQLSRVLRDAGWDDACLARAESIAPGVFDTLRLPVVREWLAAAPGRAATLASVFGYGGEASQAELSTALGEALLGAMLAGGALVSAASGRLCAALQLLPWDGGWVFADDLSGAAADAAMGPGPTTGLLYRLLPDHMAGRALDLGCGAGALALAAAPRGAVTTASDVNPRAAALVALNARFADLEIEVRTGDVDAPLRGRAFEWILAQPPFVAQPDAASSRVYLHGGARGDELPMRFVTASGRLLAPGGRAYVLIESPVCDHDPLVSRLRHALAEAPVDLLVLTSPAPSPAFQSIAFAAAAHPSFDERYAQAADLYARHFRALGIRDIVRALIVLTRPPDGGTPGGRWTVAAQARSLATDAARIDRLLAGLERASHSDAALLASRVVPAVGSSHTIDMPLDGSEPLHRLRSAAHDPFPDRELSSTSAAAVDAIASTSRVDHAIAAYAEALDAPVADVAPAMLAFIREGLAKGFLDAG